LGLFSACCVLDTLYELTSLSHVSEFCNAGKEKNLEVEFLDAAQTRKNLQAWVEKSKRDIIRAKKMI
jgi:hypothetical protein